MGREGRKRGFVPGLFASPTPRALNEGLIVLGHTPLLLPLTLRVSLASFLLGDPSLGQGLAPALPGGARSAAAVGGGRPGRRSWGRAGCCNRRGAAAPRSIACSRGTAPRCPCPCAGAAAGSSPRPRRRGAARMWRMAACLPSGSPGGCRPLWTGSLLGAGWRVSPYNHGQAQRATGEPGDPRRRRMTMKAWRWCCSPSGGPGNHTPASGSPQFPLCLQRPLPLTPCCCLGSGSWGPEAASETCPRCWKSSPHSP